MNKHWPWLAAAAALLAGAGAYAVAATDPSAAGTPTPLFAYAVTSPTCGAIIPGATPKGHFCTVTVTVRNTSDTARRPGIAFARAQDAGGADYLADAVAQIRADGTGPSLLDDLAPAAAITSRLVYDLPKDRTITSVVLRDSPTSTGTEIALS